MMEDVQEALESLPLGARAGKSNGEWWPLGVVKSPASKMDRRCSRPCIMLLATHFTRAHAQQRAFRGCLHLCTNHAPGTSTQPPPQGPLTGIRVLDLGQVVAGNFAGALLSYFGADVIKVEPPGKGDALRSLRTLDASGTSLWWRAHGRNRRCITANLHMPEGRQVVKELAGKVDVLLENFRPGVMEGWNLGPKDLPSSLIYTRISGYGQTGPRAREAGYASVCEAYGGFRHVNGYPDRPPVRPNISLGDTLAGLHAAFGTVMALLARQKLSAGGSQGGGQVVDAAISESVFAMMEACITEVAATGVDRPPSGSTISDVVPSGTFKTKEGKYVVIGGNGDSVYTRLMTAIGRPDMGSDNPKYANNSARCKHVDEIMGEIESWCAANSMTDIMSAMTKARVPAGPILTPSDILNQPQYQARGMFHTVSAPGADTAFTLPAMLPVLSATPGATRWAGPELGQHTDEILRDELGYSQDVINQLRQKGAI